MIKTFYRGCRLRSKLKPLTSSSVKFQRAVGVRFVTASSEPTKPPSAIDSNDKPNLASNSNSNSNSNSKSHPPPPPPPPPPHKKRGGVFKFLKYSFYGVVLIGGSSLVYATWPRTEKPAGVDADESPAAWAVAKRLPLNALSRLTDTVAGWYIPKPFRKPIFYAYSWFYGCRLHEATKPVDEYESLQDFFTRRLKEGVRPITEFGMASPVDGTVLHFGTLTPEGILEQIKHSEFTVDEFLGPHEQIEAFREAEQLAIEMHRSSGAKHERQPHKKVMFCTIYLAPGDYHGFHSPVEWSVERRRHFPGLLLPVSPTVVGLLKGLFAENERVVLFGSWRHGLFTFTPVGATNVGSIWLTHEPNFKSNIFPKPITKKFYDNDYGNEKYSVKPGDELGFFRLGSTIVMVFESPEFKFTVNPGDKVRFSNYLFVHYSCIVIVYPMILDLSLVHFVLAFADVVAKQELKTVFHLQHAELLFSFQQNKPHHQLQYPKVKQQILTLQEQMKPNFQQMELILQELLEFVVK